ncbi:hypothetical protein Tco_1565691, partial [Tanacetum coccineum]
HLKNFCLQSFDLILRTNGSSFDSISGMPLRDMEFIRNHTNILIHDDKLCYNKEELVMEHETLFSNVIGEQQKVYTKFIVDSLFTTRKSRTGDEVFPGDICRPRKPTKRQKSVRRGTNSDRLFSQSSKKFSRATYRPG